MSKEQKIVISYHTWYNRIWKWLDENGYVVDTFPPPIKICWDESYGITQTLAGAEGITTGRFYSNWSETTDFIMPYDYSIIIYHKDIMKLYGTDYIWEGKLPYEAHIIVMCHTLFHEISHFLSLHHMWKTGKDVTFGKEVHNRFIDYIKKLNTNEGRFKDENMVETMAMELLAEYMQFNTDLFPKWDGRFMKQQNISDQIAWAMYVAFRNDNLMTFCADKLSQDEKDRLVVEIGRIAKFMVSAYDKAHYKIVYHKYEENTEVT